MNPIVVKSSPSTPTVVVATPSHVSIGAGDSAVYASPLLDSYNSNVQGNTTSMYDNYDNRSGFANRKRRKQLIGGTCCCCCMLFLLLFFLIPRSPILYLTNVGYMTYAPYQLVQTYQITNKNPYSITLSNVNTQVTSLIISGVYQGNSVVGYGQLEGGVDQTVSIASTSQINVNIVYNFTSTTIGAVAASAKQCCTSLGALYTTSGTFDFETAIALHDYHSISLGTFQTFYVCCTTR